MKLMFVIEIEPGESAADVEAAATAWLERGGGDGFVNSEWIVEGLVKAGVNVSERQPEVGVAVVD